MSNYTTTTTMLPPPVVVEQQHDFWIGLLLTLLSDAMIGASFIFKKIGLRRLHRREEAAALATFQLVNDPSASDATGSTALCQRHSSLRRSKTTRASTNARSSQLALSNKGYTSTSEAVRATAPGSDQAFVVGDNSYVQLNDSSDCPDKEIGCSLTSSPSSTISGGSVFAPASQQAIRGNVHSQNDGILQKTAGEGGLGYLKEPLWWLGMFLMMGGEFVNFGAFAFAPTILVASMGALSVIITAVFAHIVLKERLNVFGVIACGLVFVASVQVVMNSPREQRVGSMNELVHHVSKVWFLVFCGVVVATAATLIIYTHFHQQLFSRYVLLPIVICSLCGCFTTISCRALGVAVRQSIAGSNQFTHWLTWAMLAVLLASVLVQVNFLNRALDVFGAAVVTPVYYVCFSLAVIASSVALFGWPMEGGCAIIPGSYFPNVTASNDTTAIENVALTIDDMNGRNRMIGIEKLVSFICGLLTSFVAVFLLNSFKHVEMTFSDVMFRVTTAIDQTSDGAGGNRTPSTNARCPRTDDAVQTGDSILNGCSRQNVLTSTPGYCIVCERMLATSQMSESRNTSFYRSNSDSNLHQIPPSPHIGDGTFFSEDGAKAYGIFFPGGKSRSNAVTPSDTLASATTSVITNNRAAVQLRRSTPAKRKSSTIDRGQLNDQRRAQSVIERTPSASSFCRGMDLRDRQLNVSPPPVLYMNAGKTFRSSMSTVTGQETATPTKRFLDALRSLGDLAGPNSAMCYMPVRSPSVRSSFRGSSSGNDEPVAFDTDNVSKI